MERASVLKRWSKRVASWLVVGALLGTGVACEKSAREHLAVADSAIKKGEPDRAEAAIKEALNKDPKLEEAKLRMVQVHMLRKQYEKAEGSLDEIWKAEGLDAEKLSTPQKKVLKNRLQKENYPTLYREWADSIDAKANPQKFEEVVQKGLEYDKSDPRMNTMLVDFYLKRGEALIAEGKKAEAADTFDKIYPLFTNSKTRNESSDRAAKLRKEVYAESVQARFEKEHKPKLIEAERWDEENKAIHFMVEGEYDRKLPDETAKAIAMVEVGKQINGFVLQVGAIPLDAKVGAAQKLQGITVVEEEYKKGNYKLKVSAPVTTLMAYGMTVKDRHDAAMKAAEKAKKKAKGDKGGEAEPEKKGGDAPAAKDGEKPAEGGAAKEGEASEKPAAKEEAAPK